MILPGEQIGVLGGGQLGMFFAAAARRSGYRVAVWDPDPLAPAGPWADRFISAPFDDPAARLAFLEKTSAVTFEWENVPVPLAASIEEVCPLRPASAVLRRLQNRADQKTFLKTSGLPVTPFEALQKPSELGAALERLGPPAILKTATAGYDGHGQWTLLEKSDLDSAEREMGRADREGGWILEKTVPFAKEVSVIAARDDSGAIRTYPVTENLHEGGILRWSRVPAEIDPARLEDAADLAGRTVRALGGTGVFCIEMFLLKDGGLLINEAAPRPHNSGHYSMDVCALSQFDQQVRILCGFPVSETGLLSPAVMVNVLGPEIRALETTEGLEALHSIRGLRLYHYRKDRVRPKRKMGHLLLADPRPNEITERLGQIREILNRHS